MYLKADAEAAWQSTPGKITGSERKVTEERIRTFSRQQRREERHEPAFGKCRTDQHRCALSAYTWLRTDCGTQKSWLHHLCKTATTSHSTDPVPKREKRAAGPQDSLVGIRLPGLETR